jgi:hypothetical protein
MSRESLPEVVASVVAKRELENSTTSMADFSDLGDRQRDPRLKMEGGRVRNCQNAVSYDKMNPAPIQLKNKFSL